jgi:hypothetical protein
MFQVIIKKGSLSTAHKLTLFLNTENEFKLNQSFAQLCPLQIISKLLNKIIEQKLLIFLKDHFCNILAFSFHYHDKR